MLYPKSALRSPDAVVQGPIAVTDESIQHRWLWTVLQL